MLYLDGCPNYPPTMALIREVAGELGVNVCLVPVEIRDTADAERCRFLGSSTVQVNGVDIEPSGRNRTEHSWGCRLYEGAGVPPREMIVAAIRELL